jgi:hypothetical protein
VRTLRRLRVLADRFRAAVLGIRSRIATSNFVGSSASHSQISFTRHPSVSSASRDARSFLLLRRNFSRQKSGRDAGIRATGHPVWWCQKHPWTNTTVRLPTITMSGVPGRSLRWRRNLSPSACNLWRTKTSGLEFFPLNRDINARRASSSMSAVRYRIR